ncbi:DUF4246 domain-containing protein [Aspergillus undulatus]|uniref:DUF4246 domain-containing protein n=1 Tax=Aspergillus undulatus TaxID=1810928 RepID=UPI003CCCF312
MAQVWNDKITSKWREEIAQQDIDVSTAMMDYILKELQWKATEYKKTGIVTAYDPGVVKSDLAISQDLQQRLREAVKPLENVPDEEKDYHPRSDMKVVDLVHPSLFPLIYGHTRVLRDTLIGVDDCFFSIGQGEVAELYKEPPRENQPSMVWAGSGNTYSEKFQWLPCNVEFTPNGECQIASYINNLHPAKHRDLYRVIEQILTRTLPLWNASLTSDYGLPHRIPYHSVEYMSDEEPEPEQEDGEDEDDFDERYDAWSKSRLLKAPEPGEFQPPRDSGETIDLQDQFRDKGLQVIVKMANIELTPEKPEYEGGSWHIEGQLNERICATAIYYYDSENITDNTLRFRHRGDSYYFDDVNYEQGQFEFLRVFGFDTRAGYGGGHQSITQDLGGVTCKTGRLLTFPNTLQHCVSRFSLLDRSKPGQRKILALFLIDPNRRIISTANVPPQREDWCQEWKGAMKGVLSKRLPVELQNMVHTDIEFKPMTMEEAKAHRLELMDERSAQSEGQNRAYEQGGFNLCEH